LKELKKLTPEDHIDYSSICKACSKIQEICLQINDQKKGAEIMEELLRVKRSLSGKDRNLVCKIIFKQNIIYSSF
jgi:hypothetical protein